MIQGNKRILVKLFDANDLKKPHDAVDNNKKPYKRKANEDSSLKQQPQPKLTLSLTHTQQMLDEPIKKDDEFDFYVDDSSTTSKLSDNYIDADHQITYRVGGK